MNYEIGSRVGDYEIIQILGVGGMGRVYKVRNTLSDRIEAMKVLLPDLEGTPGFADRFMREIKVQAALNHPNIAALYTAFRADNQVLMLMEYVEGTTLEKMMDAGRIPIEKALDFTVHVLSALSYAHERGVIHRDLKPANMMITPDGLVKLMDFGIARMTTDRKLTQTGSTLGSLYYMSPEQINGAADLDSRSDIYSLGVTLYEMITGTRPFQGDSGYKIMAAHLESKPLPPVQASPDLPRGLSEIIMQSLEKDPEKRFQSADAFRTALQYIQGPDRTLTAVPPPPAPVKAPQVSRQQPPPAPSSSAQPHAHRALWIAVGALIVAAVVVAAALQIPRFRRAAALGSPAAEAPAAETPAVFDTWETPAASTPVETPAEDIPPSVQPALLSESDGQSSPDEEQTKPAEEARDASSAGIAQQLAEVPVETRQPSRPPIEAAQSEQIPEPPPEDSGTTERLKEVRALLDSIYMRAETVRGSLERLRRQQEAVGLGLRADMENSAQRMEYLFNQTEIALNRRDAEAAGKNLDLAEREVSKLEEFLGQ